MNSNLTVAIKQEAREKTNSYAESFASQDDLDNESLFNASTASFTSHYNLVELIDVTEKKPNINEKVQKEEEKPVIHRNTGKICRRRFMSSLANRYYSNSPYTRNTTFTTQSLLIQPDLQHTKNNILVSTQTSPIDVVELSDEDDQDDDTYNNYQLVQQSQSQQQTPQPHILAAICNSIQQNVAAMQHSQQTVPINQSANRVYCAACNRSYVRNGFTQHKKTKKHLENERILQQRNQNTNGTDHD